MTLGKLMAAGVVVVVGLILGSVAFQITMAGGLTDLIPAGTAAVMLAFGLVAGRAPGQRWLVPATWACPAALLILISPIAPGWTGLAVALVGLGVITVMVFSASATRRWSRLIDRVGHDPAGK